MGCAQSVRNPLHLNLWGPLNLSVGYIRGRSVGSVRCLPVGYCICIAFKLDLSVGSGLFELRWICRFIDHLDMSVRDPLGARWKPGGSVRHAGRRQTIPEESSSGCDRNCPKPNPGSPLPRSCVRLSMQSSRAATGGWCLWLMKSLKNR